MKVALANDFQFAHNIISLASKLYWDSGHSPEFNAFVVKSGLLQTASK